MFLDLMKSFWFWSDNIEHICARSLKDCGNCYGAH